MVELLSGSTVLGSTTASVSGSYSITAPTLAIGNYSFSVRSTDTAGNQSMSTDINFTVQLSGHPSDDIAGAFEVEFGTSYTVGGETLVSGERSCAGYGGSVWFTWIANRSGSVELNTFGSSYDTVLSVYLPSGGSPTTVNPGELQACNDDSGGLQSRIQFSAIEGQLYYIQVLQYSGSAKGTLKINLK